MPLTDAQYDDLIAQVDRAERSVQYWLKPGEDARHYPWGCLICDPTGYRWLPRKTTVYRMSI